MAMEIRAVHGARLRTVASRMDRAVIRDAAHADAGNHRGGTRYVGPAARTTACGAAVASGAPRARHDSRRRPLRAHRAARRDGRRHPRFLGVVMRITHGRVTLALHELARKDGPSLLLLHGLY